MGKTIYVTKEVEVDFNVHVTDEDIRNALEEEDFFNELLRERGYIVPTTLTDENKQKVCYKLLQLLDEPTLDAILQLAETGRLSGSLDYLGMFAGNTVKVHLQKD